MTCPYIDRCEQEVTEEHYKYVCSKNYVPKLCPEYKKLTKKMKPAEWKRQTSKLG